MPYDFCWAQWIVKNKTHLQWNTVNTTTIGPKYFGRNNGVVVLMGFEIKQ